MDSFALDSSATSMDGKSTINLTPCRLFTANSTLNLTVCWLLLSRIIIKINRILGTAHIRCVCENCWWMCWTLWLTKNTCLSYDFIVLLLTRLRTLRCHSLSQNRNDLFLLPEVMASLFVRTPELLLWPTRTRRWEHCPASDLRRAVPSVLAPCRMHAFPMLMLSGIGRCSTGDWRGGDVWVSPVGPSCRSGVVGLAASARSIKSPIYLGAYFP